MIPVALPSAGFFILLTAGFFAGILLLGWALVLGVSGGARRTVRKYWKTSTVLCLALLAPFSFYAWFQAMMWQLERDIRREEAAHHVTLQAPTTVGGVAMPAGTRLKVQDKGQLDTYLEAAFPQAVAILGVQATSVRRYLDTEYDKEYNIVARRPRTVILRGAGEQDVQGWRCDATQDIEFDVAPDGAIKMLTQCVLAAGNQAAGLTLGHGAVVRGSGGTVYTDGSRDPDRWRIDVNDDTAVRLLGMFLSRPTVYLDDARRLLRVTGAELACPMQFGAMTYAAGTQVKTARLGSGNARGPYPGVLVFSPWHGQSAARAGAEDVPEGMSVMQTLQGEVLEVVKNDAAGVFRFDTFIIDGKEPETPARARCP